MSHVLQVWLTTTQEPGVHEPEIGGDVLYALRLDTDGMEEGQQYVEAINQALYESEEVRRWTIDARYWERHEADHSIVESLQQIIASTDIAIAIPIILRVATGIAPLLNRYIFAGRESAIDSAEVV